MRPIVFHAAAAREVQRARARYDEVAPELGEAFVQELEYVLQLAQRFPESGHPWPNDPGRRVFLLDRFPYRVVIRLRAEQLRVVTVAHHRRRPGHGSRRR